MNPPFATLELAADDATAFLAVNNAAFEWHPEQGDMMVEDLESRQSERWYEPGGFLLHEVDGEVAGFCWTKVHDDESESACGMNIVRMNSRELHKARASLS